MKITADTFNDYDILPELKEGEEIDWVPDGILESCPGWTVTRKDGSTRDVAIELEEAYDGQIERWRVAIWDVDHLVDTVWNDGLEWTEDTDKKTIDKIACYSKTLLERALDTDY